jgi:hypothetical protein
MKKYLQLFRVKSYIKNVLFTLPFLQIPLKQKASVEGSMGKISTKIIARLRDRKYHTYAELCAGVSKCLDKFNKAPPETRRRIEIFGVVTGRKRVSSTVT